MSQDQSSKEQQDADFNGSLAELRVLGDLLVTIAKQKYASRNQLFKDLSKSPNWPKKTIEEFESRWGKKLIVGKPLQLTEAGRQACEFATRVLREYEGGPFMARETLRIGTSNRVMTAFLAPQIRKFLEARRQRPNTGDVDLRLSESSRQELILALQNEEIDCAIFGSQEDGLSAEFHRYVISDHATVLIAPPEGEGPYNRKLMEAREPVRLADLDAVNVCLIQNDLTGVLAGLPRQRPGYSRIVVDNYASVISLVRSGGVVGLAFDMGLDPDLLRFEFHPADKIRARQVSIWTRADREPTGAIRQFIEVVLGRPLNQPFHGTAADGLGIP